MSSLMLKRHKAAHPSPLARSSPKKKKIKSIFSKKGLETTLPCFTTTQLGDRWRDRGELEVVGIHDCHAGFTEGLDQLGAR